MNNRFRYGTILIPALSLLLAGCALNTPPQSSETSEVPAVTETVTVTAATEATTTFSKTEVATTAVTTAAPVTSSAVTTTREIVYRHRAEILSTALLEKPLDDEYEDMFTDPEQLDTYKSLKIGKEGSIFAYCAGPDRDCVYFALQRDWKKPGLTETDTAIYRLDEATGEVTKIFDNNGLYYPFEGFLLFPFKGRMLLAAYNGLYLIDEENSTVKELDSEYSPLGPNLCIYEDRLILPSVKRTDPPELTLYEYDPVSETMIRTDDISASDLTCVVQTYFQSTDVLQTRLTCTGDTYDDIKYVFEWE